MSGISIGMGICWSEPPVQQVQMKAPLPSAPPYPQQYPQQYYAQQQYTYAPQQQQYQYQQPQMYTYAATRPQYYPPQQQQQQMGTGTAVLGGFVLGAMMEDMLDPTD